MNDKQRIQEIKNGVEKISKNTLKYFAKIFGIPKSDFTNTTLIESEIYNLFIFDYVMHSHQMTPGFRTSYISRTMDFIENKYGNELSNTNLIKIINERFNQYADLPAEGDDWSRKANEHLIMNLEGSLKNITMEEYYPINLNKDIFQEATQGMMKNLEFAKIHYSDFNVITNIVNGMYGKKKRDACHIATMVYDDYNSDEVIILRKFRDNVLDKSILGRLFVRFYYLSSPTFVQIFKNNKLINELIKKKLNIVVNRIKTKNNNT